MGEAQADGGCRMGHGRPGRHRQFVGDFLVYPAQNRRTSAEAARERQRADTESERRAEAKERERDTRHTLYAVDLNLALQAWNSGNIARMLQSLERHIPGNGDEDLRGFEWHYLWRLCHSDLRTMLCSDQFAVIAFSPNQAELLAMDPKKSHLSLIEAATGQQRAEITLDDQRVLRLARFESDQTIAVLEAPKQEAPVPQGESVDPAGPNPHPWLLRRFDLTGKEVSAQTIPAAISGADQAAAILSPDGKTLVLAENLLKQNSSSGADPARNRHPSSTSTCRCIRAGCRFGTWNAIRAQSVLVAGLVTLPFGQCSSDGTLVAIAALEGPKTLGEATPQNDEGRAATGPAVGFALPNNVWEGVTSTRGSRFRQCHL